MTTEYNEGPYRCEIVDQGLSQSKNDNPQIWLRILVKESLSPEDEGQNIPSHERTVYWTITEKTIDFVTDKLAALGFTGESFRQLDLNHTKPESFVGQIEDFYCKHNLYNGETNEKWDLSRQSEVKPLDEVEARKLDALFGRKLKDRIKSGVSKAKPAKSEIDEFNQELQSVADADDDIPF